MWEKKTSLWSSASHLHPPSSHHHATPFSDNNFQNIPRVAWESIEIDMSKHSKYRPIFFDIFWISCVIFANPRNVPCFRHRHRLWNSQTAGPRRPRGSSIHGRPFRRHLSNGRNTSGRPWHRLTCRILTESLQKPIKIQQILSNLKLRWKKVMDGDGANQCKLLRLDVFNIVQWQGHRSPIWVWLKATSCDIMRHLLVCTAALSWAGHCNHDSEAS